MPGELDGIQCLHIARLHDKVWPADGPKAAPSSWPRIPEVMVLIRTPGKPDRAREVLPAVFCLNPKQIYGPHIRPNGGYSKGKHYGLVALKSSEGTLERKERANYLETSSISPLVSHPPWKAAFDVPMLRLNLILGLLSWGRVVYKQ